MRARCSRHDANLLERADDHGLFLYPRLLAELGDFDHAEHEVLQLLERGAAASALVGLDLLAKIKHTRGQLTEAIACWLIIHAPSGPPEQHANEKVAVLTWAWMAEVAGDLGAARTILEQLGGERGFENDADRLQALARIYERSGTTPLLEAALRIHRHFSETRGRLSALGKIAMLHRRLGELQRAEACETAHAVAYGRWMQRLSRDDVVCVASDHHVRLDRLRQIRVIPSARVGRRGNVPPRDARHQALHAFFEHDIESARRLFAQGQSLLDRKYVAQLAILAGDRRAGVRAGVALVEEDPEDLQLVRMLLEEYAVHRDQEVADVFRSERLRDHVTFSLDEATRTSPRDANLWRNQATLLLILGRSGESVRSAERAAALATAERRRHDAVGRVLAGAVLHLPCGEPKGIIHEIWADRTPARHGSGGGGLAPEDMFGNLTPEMTHAVRSTFFAVREYALARFPQRTSDIMKYAYSFKMTKDDEISSGLSAGLPIALAFLSVFLQRPVPQDAAFSGVIITDAHDVLAVHAVGEAGPKVASAYERNLRILVLPRDNEASLKQSGEVPAAVVDELVRFARSLDDALPIAFGKDIWVGT